jgi:hypothetical protein
MHKSLASATLLIDWMLWKQRNAGVFEDEKPLCYPATLTDRHGGRDVGKGWSQWSVGIWLWVLVHGPIQIL